jgi:hypothetical protein
MGSVYDGLIQHTWTDSSFHRQGLARTAVMCGKASTGFGSINNGWAKGELFMPLVDSAK